MKYILLILLVTLTFASVKAQTNAYNELFIQADSAFNTKNIMKMDKKDKQLQDQVYKMLNLINTLLFKGHKTDIDAQITCMKSLSDNFMRAPVFLSVIESLKELRAIKRNKTL